MVIVAKKLNTFEVVFRDPTKSYYSSGDKVAGNVLVEVSEVTKVSAMRVFGIGCAKVEYAKGKQKCREEIEYLKYEDVVHLDDQPAGNKHLPNRTCHDSFCQSLQWPDSAQCPQNTHNSTVCKCIVTLQTQYVGLHTGSVFIWHIGMLAYSFIVAWYAVGQAVLTATNVV